MGNGQEIFAMNHAQVVSLIKNSGDSISLAVERGDFIVPNFEEIWPSGKNKNKPSERPDPMDYVLEAMKLGIPGIRILPLWENQGSQSISMIIQSNVTRKKLLKI